MLAPGVLESNTATPERLMAEWSRRDPSWSEYMGANVAESFERTTTDAILTEQRVLSAERDAYGNLAPGYQEQMLTDSFGGTPARDEGNQPIYISEGNWNKDNPLWREGITWREDMTEERARIYAEDYDKRIFRQNLIARGQDSFGFFGGTVSGFFAGVLGSLPDPINLIPFAGGYNAAGKGVIAGVRAGVTEGALSNAAVDALVFPDLSKRGADVGFADFALDTAFGAALGGILGGAGGWLRVRSERAAQNLLALEAARNAESAAERVRIQQTHGVFEAVGGDRFYQMVDESLRPAEFDALPDRFFSTFRQTVHGLPRQEILNAMEKSVNDFADGLPMDVGPILRESEALGRAWDMVEAEIATRTPAGRPGEILVVIDPADQPSMGVQRGPMAEINGETRAAGRDAERVTGSRSGYGLTKVQIEHPDVTRADVMSIPRIMREYEADASHGAGRTWVVERADGRQLVIGETKTADGGMLATVHLVDEGASRPLSEKITTPRNPDARFAAYAPDTDGSLTIRDGRSPQGKVRLLRDGQDVNALAPDFRTETPETFTPAPPLREETVNALESMGADPKSGRTLEEVQAVEQAELGLAPPEEATALRAAQDMEVSRMRREEEGYSIMRCIMEVVE